MLTSIMEVVCAIIAAASRILAEVWTGRCVKWRSGEYKAPSASADTFPRLSSHTYPLPALTTMSRVITTGAAGMQTRLDIRDLVKNEKQFTLYIRALGECSKGPFSRYDTDKRDV